MSTNSGRRGVLWRTLVVAWVLIEGAFALFAGEFADRDRRALDRLFRIRQSLGAAPAPAPAVVIVEVGDDAYDRHGYAWSTRAAWAGLLGALDEMGVRAALVDVAFLGPTDPELDRSLLAVSRAFGRAYFPVVLSVEGPGRNAGNLDPEALALRLLGPEADAALVAPATARWGRIAEAGSGARTMPGLLGAAAGVGHITTHPDPDGVYRRARMALRVGDRMVPALSLRVAADLVGATSMEVEAGRELRLLSADGRTAARIPINDRGEALINHPGPWGAVFPHYPAHKLLEASEDEALFDRYAEELGGTVAVVCDVSTRGQDFGATPLEEIHPKGGLHAALLSSLLTGRTLVEAGGPWPAAIHAALAVAVGAAAALFGAPLFAAFAAGLAALYLASAIALFARFGIVVPMAAPTVLVIALALTALAHRYFWAERDRATLRRHFESYLPAPVLDRVLRSPELLAQVQRKRLTVLFSDISGFTRWSATQPPAAIHAVLNAYFDEMTAIVFRHGGTVDKYIGDGLLVFFGDPVDQPDHTARALAAAVEMQRRARELEPLWRERGWIPVRIRVGVHVGEVAVGNMGSERRMDYTVIGSAVNLAQRLEGAAPVGGVLVSAETREEAGPGVPFAARPPLALKGFDGLTEVFEISPEHLEPRAPGFSAP